MLRFAVAMALLVSVVRLGSDMYLPGIPAMQRELHLPDAALAATISVYFGVFAFAALLAGPLSDARGRRVLVLGGMVLFVVGTVLCGLAGGIVALLVGRFLQALGGSAMPVVTRAMARDHCDDRQFVEVLGWIGVLNGVVPVLAPVLGGALTQFGGWRANFEFLLAVALGALVWTWAVVPETHPPERRTPLDLRYTLGQFRRILVSRLFLLPLLPVLTCFALQGVYLAVAPFVFVRDLGLTPLEFGLTNIPLVIALVVGRALCVGMLRRFSGATTVVASGGLVLLGSVAALAVLASEGRSVPDVLVPMLFFSMGFGSLLPLGQKAVMTAFREVGGTASSLHSGATFSAAALGSLLGGAALHHAEEIPVLLAALAGGGVIVFVSCWWARGLVD